MKTLVLLCSAILILIAPSRSLAQPLPYADADTPGEAIGIYKMTIGISERMRRECSARFPELGPAIERDLEKWRRIDAQEIRHAEQGFQAMERASPQLRQQFEQMLRQGYENKLVTPFIGMEPAIEKSIMHNYCQQYFGDLASGIWRQRTPRVYQFLNASARSTR